MSELRTIPSYNALALQATCKAVNLLTASAARSAMLESITRIHGLIRGSTSFLQSFSGSATRLVVLPEYFLTSFPLGESFASWIDKACLHPDGPEYQALGAIARDQDIYLSGNVYEVDDHFPGLYFQTSFIIEPTGDVILRYRRLVSMFAPTPHDILERYVDVYGPEALFPVVDTPIGRLACVASEEILYPEITRALMLRGAEVICHSSSEVGSPQATPKNIAKLARAYENMVYVVSANSADITDIPFPASSTNSHSQVVDYHGHILGEAGPGESMVGNGGIDINGLREARRRPGMTNVLARQRLELFAATYSDRTVYPANTMLKDGAIKVPERAHFTTTLRATIERLAGDGII